MLLDVDQARQMRKERSIFQDSPSCLNYGLPVSEHSCSECWLTDYVATEKQAETVPCHHIPLTDRGNTVTTLDGAGDAPGVQKALIDWLQRTIRQLEDAVPQSQQPIP